MLRKTREGDLREDLWRVSIEQDAVKNAALNIIVCGVYRRTTQKYGDRGHRYVHMEAGHACENLYLQAKSLGLGMVTMGAFLDAEVQGVIGADEEEEPLYVVPVGRV